MELKREALANAPKFKRLFAGKGKSAKAVVDRTGGEYGAGLITGVSLCTRGEALGHGLWLDEEFIASVADGVNLADGVKSRFTHPGLSSDGLGKHLGRVPEGTVDGDQARGDFHFTKSSHRSPDGGDLSGYVMDMAEESPEDFATSIVYEPDFEAEMQFMIANGATVDRYGWVDTSTFKSPDPKNEMNLPHARLSAMIAVDFVGDPAANPDGLFAREQKFAIEATELASFALGVSDKRPETVALGLDAERVKQFVNRYLTENHLEIVPMKKGLNDQKPVDEKPADNSSDTKPAGDNKPAEAGDNKPAESSSEGGSSSSSEDEPPSTPSGTAQQSAGRAEAKKFQDAFGDDGLKWFAAGLSFDQAQGEFNKSTKAKLEQLSKENADLKTKLGNVGKQGELTPVGADPADEKKKTGFAGKLESLRRA